MKIYLKIFLLCFYGKPSFESKRTYIQYLFCTTSKKKMRTDVKRYFKTSNIETSKAFVLKNQDETYSNLFRSF